MSWMIKLGVFGEAMAANADGAQLGFAFVGYLIFSIYMTIGSMETNKVLFIIFFLIDLLFLGLSMSTLMGSHFGHTLAAYSELGISITAFYGSAANVLNATFEREFLPLGKPFGIFKK
jgi:succinate-acetate transporter protein